jgi:Flp pilus assembly protein TadG
MIFTFALPVLLGGLGLVVDLGWSYFVRQEARAAAEAAALSAAAAANTSSHGAFVCGSNGVVCQGSTQCPTTIASPTANDFDVACAYAKDNGFAVTTGGTQNVMVAANTGTPPTVAGITVPYWVTVTVSQSLPQTFSAILGHRFSTVSVRATATYTSGSSKCVYVLDPSAPAAISMVGGSSLQTSCSIYANSSSSDAIDLKGGSSISTGGGATTNINGSWKGTGNSSISPAPNTNTGTVSDPFASMPAPAVGSCTSTGGSLSGTLDPGVYCGSVSFSGAVSLNPGTYIFKNGFSIGSSVTGTGVTLYVAAGSISLSGQGSLTISAPTSGTYQGIAIYQDRADTNGVSLVGGSTLDVSGVIYAPAANVSLSGNSGSSTVNTTIVANTLSLNGTTSFKHGATTAYTPGGTGAALIE